MSRFYNVSLLVNHLDDKTESVFFDYILNFENGIYYVNQSRILDVPSDFNSKSASRYLGSIELLLRYKN